MEWREASGAEAWDGGACCFCFGGVARKYRDMPRRGRVLRAFVPGCGSVCTVCTGPVSPGLGARKVQPERLPS